MKKIYKIDEDGVVSHLETRGRDEVTIMRTQDVTPYLTDNKKAYNSHSTKKKTRFYNGTFHKVASIPKVVVDMWQTKHGINFLNPNETDRKKIKQLLNDPDNRFLRTMPGQI